MNKNGGNDLNNDPGIIIKKHDGARKNIKGTKITTKKKNNEHSSKSFDTDEGKNLDDYLYKTGIPTLRSSAHRVKYSPKHRNNSLKTNKFVGVCLPPLLCESSIMDYDTAKYDFNSILLRLLQDCDDQQVGGTTTNAATQSLSSSSRLEDWRVPTRSMTRRHHGGTCEDSQAYLSHQLSTHEGFLNLFDIFVESVVLPQLKRQLQRSNNNDKKNINDHLSTTQIDEDDDEEQKTTFYYQRPPTLRLQPGPARAHVKAHRDSQYGHQDGEVNFWIPLTDRKLTGVDLYLETKTQSDNDDNPADETVITPNSKFEAMPVNKGQILQFHGTRVQHYVNANKSPYTRVSMDFRVGIEGYFDSKWAMAGTTADHTRKQIRI